MLLTTRIVHASDQAAVAQTGDSFWFLIIIAIALISGIVVFKKKFVKVLLSFALVFSFAALAPIKSFADQLVTITDTAEVSKNSPAKLTITNNDEYAVTVNSIDISNQIMSTETTWDVCIQKDSYELDDINNFNSISFDIPAHSSFDIFVNPNTEDELPVGELCTLSFMAVSSHYKASYKNLEDNVSAINEFNFSFASLEKADPTVLNRDIATLSAAFACIPNTYNNLILEGSSYGVDNRIAFMRTLGFEDNIYCKLWPDQHEDVQADACVSISRPSYDTDKDDVTSFCFNHKKLNFGSHNTEIINISVGATGGSFEWASNFDYGADKTTDYWTKPFDPSEHPDWINYEDHKGFDIARYRLMYAYNSYFSKYIDSDPNVNKIILINGHSRGGGIANLLGRDFESRSDYKSFTYTFASPNTTAISLNNADNSIFNIINRDDLVSQFPGYISGFYKYGKDIELSVCEDTSINDTLMKTVFENKSGYGEYNGNDPDEVQALIEATCDLIQDRNSAYTLNSQSSKDYLKFGSYGSFEEAQNDIPSFKEHLKNNNLEKYAYVYEDPEEDEFGNYRIKFHCCAAFIMQDISNFVFLNDGDPDKYKPSLGYNYDLINVLLEAIGVISGVQHSHIWMSYNMLATYDKY